MRRSHAGALLVVSAVLAGAASSAPTAPTAPTRKALEGDWETVIVSPKRPWIFLVRLNAGGLGWTGTMSVRGFPDLPLRDIRMESTHVHFQFPTELDSIVFDGTLINGEIVGHVVEGADETPTRLTRVVPLPAPKNRLEAWQQDLDYARSHLLAYDRSFAPRTRESFEQAVTQLRRELSRKNDAEILVALAHAVALVDNAHTRLRLDPTRQGTFATTLPIRMWWFSNGPYVVRAAAAYRRALRCRVVAIEGHPLSEVRTKVASLFAGNAAWADYLSPIYLTNPDVLYGLGLIRTRKEASFTFEEFGGARFNLSIASVSVDRDAMPDEAWQELSPLTLTGKPPWATALAANAAALPLYLRHPDRPYWFEYSPESSRLYIQFNHADDAPTGPSFASFGASVLAFAANHAVREVVLDLRLNSGGNLDVAQAFMKNLGRDRRIDRAGRLFVVVGPCTFSAGLYHAAQLKQYTHAIFVGEAVGDRLDYWAEGGTIVLPNSQAVLDYANGFHRYSERDYPERQPYYEELRIPSLVPDIAAPMTSVEYFAGRDPALAAIDVRLRR
jgi:hypothetical protein